MDLPTFKDRGRAEDVLVDFLGRETSPSTESLDDLCAQHPRMAGDLRSLFDAHARACEALEAVRSSCGGREGYLAELAAITPKPDRYEPRGKIATGGMGLIVEVWDRELRRSLAMKLLRPPSDPNDPREVFCRERRKSRLLNEAQILAQLDHPGVVPVHEVGVDTRGELYFTMQLVRGQHLGEVIESVHDGDERWSRDRVVSVLRRVCEAAAHAHAKGVLHRDLKPTNVMVGPFGEVYVMDWGLAKVVDSPTSVDPRLREAVDVWRDWDSKIDRAAVETNRKRASDSDGGSPFVTMDGDVVGTPTFMAPEQAVGEIERVDTRSDVYSVGAMLYHLLVGREPYCAESAGSNPQHVLDALIAHGPEPLRTAAPDAPEELVAVCEKAMAREPERRYPTMMALAADLGAYLEGRVVRAHRTGIVAELAKWIGRNKGVATAILAATLGLGAVAVIEARAARAAERQGAALLQKAYANQMMLAGEAFSTDDIPELKAELARCPEPLRGWEWRFLDRWTDSSDRTLLGHTRAVVDASFSPDGELLATASRDLSVRVWSPSTGTLIRRIEGFESLVTLVAFTPDGERLVVGERHAPPSVYDPATGKLVARLAEQDTWTSDIAFSPDGRSCAISGADGLVRIWNVETWALEHELKTGANPVRVVYLRDGQRLATGATDGKLRVHRIDTGEIALEQSVHFDRIDALEATPDGLWLVTGGWDERVVVFSAWTLQRVNEIPGFPARVSDLVSRGDGLVTACASGSVVYVWDSTRSVEVARLCGHDADVRRATYSPDGTWIATSSVDGTARLWDMRRADRMHTVQAGRAPVDDIEFTPDGSLMVAHVRGRDLQVWDPSERRLLSSFPMNAGEGVVSVSPAGDVAAVGLWKNEVRVVDLTSGKVRASFRVSWPRDVSFDAGGDRLAVASHSGEVRVLDWARGETLWTARAHEGQAYAAVFAGERIVTSGDDGHVAVLDAATGDVLERRRIAGVRITGIRVSPDGLSYLSCDREHSLRLWDMGDHSLLWRTGTGGLAGDIAFAPDGRRVFTGDEHGSLSVIDGATGERIVALKGEAKGLHACAVSLDGALVVTGHGDGRIRFWGGYSPERVVKR